MFLAGLSAPVPGCTAPAGPTGVLDLAALGWAPQGGVLVVPASAPGTPLPVVFAFHGAYGTGEDLRARLRARRRRRRRGHPRLPECHRGHLGHHPGVSGWAPRGPADSAGSPRATASIRRASTSPASAPARSSPSTSGATCLRRSPASPWWRGATLGSTPAAARSPCRASSSTAPATRRSRSKRDAPRARVVASRDDCSTTTTADGAHCFAYACPAPWAVDGCEWDGDHALPDWAGAEIARFFSLSP